MNVAPGAAPTPPKKPKKEEVADIFTQLVCTQRCGQTKYKLSRTKIHLPADCLDIDVKSAIKTHRWGLGKQTETYNACVLGG